MCPKMSKIVYIDAYLHVFNFTMHSKTSRLMCPKMAKIVYTGAYLRVTGRCIGYYHVPQNGKKSLMVYFIHITVFDSHWNIYTCLRSTSKYLLLNIVRITFIVYIQTPTKTSRLQFHPSKHNCLKYAFNCVKRFYIKQIFSIISRV